jgi:NTP pyrophosphatase (non-canonical NTP hydrolase)
MDRIDDLMKRIVAFRDDRDWAQFHTPENLAKSIMIEGGELLEHFQWGDSYDEREIAEELADILIYAFLLSDAIGVDVYEIMKSKLDLNESRFPVERVRGNSGKFTKVE